MNAPSSVFEDRWFQSPTCHLQYPLHSPHGIAMHVLNRFMLLGRLWFVVFCFNMLWTMCFVMLIFGPLHCILFFVSKYSCTAFCMIWCFCFRWTNNSISLVCISPFVWVGISSDIFVAALVCPSTPLILHSKCCWGHPLHLFAMAHRSHAFCIIFIHVLALSEFFNTTCVAPALESYSWRSLVLICILHDVLSSATIHFLFGISFWQSYIWCPAVLPDYSACELAFSLQSAV